MIPDPSLAERLLTGPPIVLSGDPLRVVRAAGGDDVAGTVARLLREVPARVRAHHELEIEAGADVITALTSHTMPCALAEIGMSFRAAALTGRAVELAVESAAAAGRVILVAGALGHPTAPAPAAANLEQELAEHAGRLVAAGCHVAIVRSLGSSADAAAADALLCAVRAASAIGLPVWAVVDCGPETVASEAQRRASRALESGASAILFECDDAPPSLLELLGVGMSTAPFGFLLGASAEVLTAPDAWAESCLRLADGGARLLGGSAGTTPDHLRALAERIGARAEAADGGSPLPERHENRSS